MADDAIAAAARDAFRAGRAGEAVQAFLDGAADKPRTSEAWSWMVGPLHDLGLDAAAFALQVAITQHRADNRTEWPPLIQSIAKSGDPWWAWQLASEHWQPSQNIDQLHVELALQVGEPAASLIEQWLAANTDQASVSRAIDWYCAEGCLQDAESLAQSSGHGEWQARLALWRGDLATADALLDKLAADPNTDLLRAIAAAMRGDLDEARRRLRALEDADVSYAARCEIWSWIATVERKRGNYDDAVRAADQANRASPLFTVAPRLEREIAVEMDQASNPDDRPWWRRLLQKKKEHFRSVEALEYCRQLAPFGLDPDERVAPALSRVVDALAGNRSAITTINESGTIRKIELPLDPRHLGASLQRVLWTRGLGAVRELFATAQPEIARHPLARIYLGEVELWCGGYRNAEAIFREVLDQQKRTLWAWIGLGATRMFQGDLDDAMRTWEEGVRVMSFEGPTLFVYRGECRRRLGDREGARADLETAIEQKPQRLSARINLALLEGDHQSLERAARDCQTFAPILMETLDGESSSKLEGVLTAMRGNRSSSPDLMCYELWGETWRRDRRTSPDQDGA